MPALVLFGVRSRFNGDDLTPFSFVVVVVRVLQIAVLSPLIGYTSQDPAAGIEDVEHNITFHECVEQTEGFNETVALVLAYHWGTFVFCVMSIATELAIIKTSMQGTPTQPEARTRLVPLLAVKLIPLGISVAVVAGLGIMTVAVSRDIVTCYENKDHEDAFSYALEAFVVPGSPYFVFLCVLVLSQAIEACLFLFLFLWRSGAILDACLGRIHQHSREPLDLQKMDSAWERTCLICCRCSGIFTCFLFGGHHVGRKDFDDVGKALTDFFDDGGTLDVVTSDILAGLMMLVMLQTKRKMEAHRALRAKLAETYKAGESQPNIEDMQLEEFHSFHGFDMGDFDIEESGDESDSFYSCGSLNESAVSKINLSGRPLTSQQSERRRNLTCVLREAPNSARFRYQVREILSPNRRDDCYAMAEGARFMRHALATYTWKIYVYSKPCCGLCRLGALGVGKVKNRTKATVRSKEEPQVVGDNVFGFNEVALGIQAGSGGSVELLYAQFRNNVNEAPYAILVDHTWKSVVLSVRGSLSFEDVVLDATFTPESLEGVGEEFGFDGVGEFSHRGILMRSRWIQQDLNRHKILETLLAGSSAKYPHYRLRVVGHSLGAGCAVILSFMLRKKFPALRCLSFSPPGGLLSWRSASSCKDFVTSYIINDDLVPRLSIENMESLRDDVLMLIARIKVPKFQLARAYGKRTVSADIVEDCDALLYSQNNIPETEFKKQIERFRQVQNDRLLERDYARIDMFPPGRIVHISKTGKTRGFRSNIAEFATCGLCSGTNEYTPRWASNRDFREIIVSADMAADHLPDHVLKVLEMVCSSYGVNPFCPPE